MIGVVLVTLLAYVYYSSRGPDYQLTTVTRGDITHEVLASGNLEAPTTAKLHFKISGKLASLPAHVGQNVAAGDILATLDSSVLEANYNAARAVLAREEATYAKLIAGTRNEDIAVTTAAQQSASVSLANKELELTRTIETVDTSLDSTLSNKVDQLFSNPKTNPDFGTTIESGSTKYFIAASTPSEQASINNLRRQVGDDLAALKDSIAANEELMIRDQKARNALSDMLTLLSHIAAAINEYTGTDTTAQSIYQSYQTAIATARTTTETDRQSLLSAESAYQSAGSSLKEAERQLIKTSAPSRQEDLQAAAASVDSARAQVDAAAAALNDARITSPIAGIVTNTNGTVGEIVQPETMVVTVMPQSLFDIKVNVSEDNIIGVQVGDPVHIELDAFPSRTTFRGTVKKIDPAETIIGGAVYYQATVHFDKNYENLRSGMTANVWIETGHATDVLLVPASALQTDRGQTTVSVLEKGRPVLQEVTTGMTDQNGMVEVLTGLTEGMQVILGEKN